MSRNTEALSLLAEARKLLDNCISYEATLEQIASLLVSSLASWCSIDLVSEDSKIVRVAVTHRDPNKADLAREMLLHYPPSPTARRGVYRVVETGQSIMIPDITESMWALRADNPRHLELIMELGSKSYMCVPLIARSQVVGAVMLLSGEKTFDEKDLKTAEELARSMAMAMDNVYMFRKMQEAVRVRDEFLATLSHEIRTPLNVILGWVDILKTEKLDEHSFQQTLEILDRNSRLQARMINDLLDLSRVVSGKLCLQLSAVDLEKVLSSSVESMNLAAKKKGISLQMNVTDKKNNLVMGDASHLQRMIMNLLGNAIKFTPAGGLVMVELSQSNDKMILVVKDTGIGIASDFLPHIFEAFRQADGSTTRSHEGLGLGLAITKHIVSAHEGSISSCSPGLGLGSEFIVHLPLLKDACMEIQNSNLSPQSRTSNLLQGIQILLVDDCEDIRILLTRYLEKDGAQVTAVSSAAQALDSLRSVKPHILLSDISMPEMDGYELISRIRKLPDARGGNILAVALTAFAREEEEQKTLAAGFDWHLSKPISGADLIANVHRLLQLGVSNIPMLEPFGPSN